MSMFLCFFMVVGWWLLFYVLGGLFLWGLGGDVLF